jgi:type I restriction-modification system DNA methylase subunit
MPLMSSAASNLVSKVWNYCNLLRDDGVSYGDYVEQLTFLLFLKMDYERTRPPYKRKSSIPEDYNWASLGDSSDLPDPAVLAAEIVEDLQAALDQFAQIAADLGVGERDTGSG